VTLDERDASTSEATVEWNRIARDNWIYTVALFALFHTPEGDLLSLAGTGTLVASGDGHYILTAAHVWHEVLKKADKVGITLREVEIKEYARDTDLTELPMDVAYRVDGVHLYADILNLAAMLNVTDYESDFGPSAPHFPASIRINPLQSI
jgi:hypothetical protein